MGGGESRRGLGAALARLANRLQGLLPGSSSFLGDLLLLDTGRRGEAAAARHLRRSGLRIVGRNLRARSGEIDLLALDGSTLVFVEVKSSALLESDPLGRITPAKARRLRRAAALYRRKAGASVEACRLDGVVVRFRRGRWARLVTEEVRWYPGIYPLDDL